MRYTLTVCKQSGETIYRNANLNKEQYENLIGLNTLKLNKINMKEKNIESLVKGGSETFFDAVVVAVAAMSGLLIMVIVFAII